MTHSCPKEAGSDGKSYPPYRWFVLAQLRTLGLREHLRPTFIGLAPVQRVPDESPEHPLNVIDVDAKGILRWNGTDVTQGTNVCF